MDDESANIRVICRFRPVNAREKAEGADATCEFFKFQGDTSIEVAEYQGRGPHQFTFDKIFWDTSTTQEEVYNLAARKTIDDVIKGYNGTIFAYGQTGAGKSFTMFGADLNDSNLKGIIPRACSHIFDHIANDTEGTEYTIKCSFLEIYKEVIRDLLNPGANTSKAGLRIRETPEKGVWVEGLCEEYVSCVQDVLNLLVLGEKYRATSSTDMNATSSRSHSLFILTLHQKSPDGSTKEGKLNLADLAGSEKVRKTGASGDTLEEAKKINQSLSALGNCINALTKQTGKHKPHIPYRDSRLTFILRESLGGNTKTTLLVACSPHIFNLEETISTLQFAKRAKTIKNTVKINKQRSVAELMAIIEKLKKELNYFMRYTKILEQELERINGPNWKDSLPKLPSRSAAKTAASSSESAGDESGTGRKDDDEEADMDSASDSESRPSLSATPSHSRSPSDALLSPRSEADLREAFIDGSNAPVKIAELKVELQRLEERTTMEIQNLTEESKRIGEENNNLMTKLHKKKQEVKQAQNTVKEVNSQMQDILEQKEKLTAKFAFEKQQLEMKLDQQEGSLNKALEQSKEDRERLASVQKSLEEVTEEREKLTLDIQRLERQLRLENEKMEEKLQSIEEMQEKQTELETQVRTLKSDLEDKELEHGILKQQITSLENRLTIQQQNTSTSESQISELISHEQELRSESSADSHLLQIQIEGAKKQVERLQNRIQEEEAEYQRKLAVMEEKTKAVNAKLLLEKEKSQQAEDANLDLSRQLVEKDQQCRRVNNELSSLSREADYLRNLTNNQQQSMHSQSERIKQLEAEILKMEEEKRSVQQELNSALEINVENARQFERMLEMAKEAPKRAAVVRVPVKADPRSPLEKFFGMKSLPLLGHLQPPIRSGPLLKRSAWLRRWDKKWFVVFGDSLYYFESINPNTKASGAVELIGCKIAPAGEITGKKNTFGIFHPSRKNIFLQASSEEEQLDWLNTLRTVAGTALKSSSSTPKTEVARVPSAAGNLTPMKSSKKSSRLESNGSTSNNSMSDF